MTRIATDPVHGLEVSVGTSVRSETWLNGILLARKEAGQTGVESLAIQHDMVPGQNLAEVRLGLPGMDLNGPPAPIPGTPPATAGARLLLQVDEPRPSGGSMEITTRDLDQALWDPSNADDPVAVSLPHRLLLTFTPQSPVVAPPWLEGAPQPADQPSEAVYARMAELAEMLRTGDLDAYDAATAVRREHMARSYPLGLDAEAARVQDREEFEIMRAEPGFTVALVPRDQARFRAMAGGRLMDWTGPDGDSALTISSRSVPPSPVNLQFSVIGGRLLVTR